MASDNWKVYNKFKEYMADGALDLDLDAFKVALFLAASNCETLTFDELGDLTSQVAPGNGYATGGNSVTSVTWVEASGTLTFDSDDPSFTAAGGTIVFRFAVLYDDTVALSPPTDALVCFTLADNAPLDVTIADGETLNLVLTASGYFTLTGT